MRPDQHISQSRHLAPRLLPEWPLWQWDQLVKDEEQDG